MLFMLLCCFLTSCALTPTVKEMATADYGTAPTEARAALVCKQWLSQKYPDVQFGPLTMTRLDQAWISGTLVQSGELFPGNIFGYGVHASVHSEDPEDTLTGNWRWQFLIKNDDVVWGKRRMRKSKGLIYRAGVEFVDDTGN